MNTRINKIAPLWGYLPNTTEDPTKVTKFKKNKQKYHRKSLKKNSYKNLSKPTNKPSHDKKPKSKPSNPNLTPIVNTRLL